MKRSGLLAVCICSAILLAAGILGVALSGTTPADPRLSVNSTANSDLSQETPPPASSAQETAAAQTPKYRICEYEGKVAVFLAGRELPYQILETRVDSLPEYDQELLREGIAAQNEQELLELLQDYGS